MKPFVYVFVFCLGLAACGGNEPEVDAQVYLTEARVMLQVGHYRAARDTIFALRRRFPTSFQAREHALLLLDSIELMAAEDSLNKAIGANVEELQIRVEFYRRKLELDKADYARRMQEKQVKQKL